jgi:hypothetical protein
MPGDRLIIKDLERSGHDLIEVLSRNFLGRAEENHNNLNQYSRFPDRDSNQTPPE